MSWQHIPLAKRLARLEAHLEKLLAYKASKTGKKWRHQVRYETALRDTMAEIDKLKRQIAGEKKPKASYSAADPQVSIHNS